MKASEVKKMADTMLENGGVGTRERFMQALPLLFSLREAAAGLAAFSKALNASADALSEGAAAYAKDHAKALDEPLHEVAKGKTAGSVEIGTNRYTLTLTDGPLKRVTGDNMTESFLARLPGTWIKSKPVLDVTAINKLGVSEEILFKHGLIRAEKRAWTMKTAAEAAEGDA